MTWDLGGGSREYQVLFTSSHLLHRSPDCGNRGTKAFPQSLYSSHHPICLILSKQHFSHSWYLGCLPWSVHLGKAPTHKAQEWSETMCAALTVTLSSTVHSWGTSSTPRPLGQGKNLDRGRYWTCNVGKFKCCSFKFCVKEQFSSPSHVIPDHPSPKGNAVNKEDAENGLCH